MYLTDRHQIAKAMNFGQFPVLFIDMENDKGYGPNFAEGCNVKMVRGDNYYHEGHLIYSDGRYLIQSGMIGLFDSFGRDDVIEMYQRANYPLIWKDTPVIIVEDYPFSKVCKVRVMYAPNRKFDIFCQTAMVLEPIEKDPVKTEAFTKFLEDDSEYVSWAKFKS